MFQQVLIISYLFSQSTYPSKSKNLGQVSVVDSRKKLTRTFLLALCTPMNVRYRFGLNVLSSLHFYLSWDGFVPNLRLCFSLYDYKFCKR